MVIAERGQQVYLEHSWSEERQHLVNLGKRNCSHDRCHRKSRSDRAVVREFFELSSRLPGSFIRAVGTTMSCCAMALDWSDEQSAQLVLIYAGKELCQESSGNHEPVAHLERR